MVHTVALIINAAMVLFYLIVFSRYFYLYAYKKYKVPHLSKDGKIIKKYYRFVLITICLNVIYFLGGITLTIVGNGGVLFTEDIEDIVFVIAAGILVIFYVYISVHDYISYKKNLPRYLFKRNGNDDGDILISHHITGGFAIFMLSIVLLTSSLCFVGC